MNYKNIKFVFSMKLSIIALVCVSLFFLAAVKTASKEVERQEILELNYLLDPNVQALSGFEGYSPVRISTGELVYQETDFQIPLPDEDEIIFGLQKIFASKNAAEDGPFGKGWRHLYQSNIEVSGKSAKVKFMDGTQYNFIPGPDNIYHEKHTGLGKLVFLKDTARWMLQTQSKVYYYNSNGALIVDNSIAGIGVQLSYKDDGKLIAVKDRFNRQITFIYDKAGHIIKAAKLNGKVWKYTYDSKGFLVAEKDPLGNTTGYEYDSKGLLTRIIDVDGDVKFAVSYDSSNRALSYTEKGITWKMSYFPADKKTKKTDPLGRSTTYFYNKYGFFNKIVFPDGNCREVKYKDGYLTSSVNIESGAAYSYKYNKYKYPIEEKDSDGNNTTWDYLADTNLVTLTKAPKGLVTKYVYDKNRYLIETTIGVGLENPKTSKAKYNDAGLRIQETSAGGITKYLKHDIFGNVVEERIDDDITKYEYDMVGNRISRVNSDGSSIKYTYDALDRLIECKHSNGTGYKNIYDAVGNIIGIEYRDGTKESFIYDKNNRLIEKISRGLKYAYKYDAVGNVISKTMPNGCQLKYEYDNMNRAVSYTNRIGAAFSVEYDASGNPSKITDGEGNTWKEKWNANGEIEMLENPLGAKTLNKFDSTGNLISRTDANGKTTNYRYDPFNRLTGISYPNGEQVNITYNDMDLPVKMVSAAAEIIYEYDKAFRLIKVTDAKAGKSVSYKYNKNGAKTTVIYPGGTVVEYDYDNKNRVTEIRKNKKKEVTYVYDDTNHKKIIHYANGIKSVVSINKNHQVVKREDRNAKGRLTFSIENSYSPDGQLAKRHQTMCNKKGKIKERFITYTYDAEERLVTEQHKDKDGKIIFGFEFAYDRNNNRIVKLWNDGRKTAYIYDQASRLVSETTGGYKVDYSYDPNGCLVKQEDSKGKIVKYKYDSDKRLIAMETPGEKIGLTLAPDSRMLKMKVNDKELEYIYDGVNIIQQIEEPGKILDFVNGLGINEVISRSGGDVEGKSRYYVHGLSNSVVQILNEKGKIESDYDYDAFGSLLNRHAEEIGQDFGFASAVLLSAKSETYYFRERIYTPGTGRFLSLDPIRADAAEQVSIFSVPGTETQIGDSPLYQQRLEVNLKGMDVGGYLYAGSNPVSYQDPTGAFLIWNPFSASITSGCAGSGCPASGCTGSVCVGSGCISSGCVGSGCVGSGCGGSGCVGSGCVGSVCVGSGCATSACGGSGCVGSGCVGSGCAGSACVGSGCVGSGCIGSACSSGCN